MPGIDLDKEPTVTKVDGGELREWAGCRIWVPDDLGEVGPAEAKGNGCRSHHGAPQETVEAILDRLWPKIADCRTAKALGAVILAAGVEASMKFKLACLARDRLGFSWKEETVRAALKPGCHTLEHIERVRATSRKATPKWRAANLERAKATAKASTAKWLSLPENYERKRIANAKATAVWKAANYQRDRDYQRRYNNARRKDDEIFALVARMRIQVYHALRRVKAGKTAPTLKLIGCTPEFLKAHLASQFVDGMSWDNRELWHVDHIRPLASWDLNDPLQQAEAFHWTNLQPMWASENKSKGSLHEGKRHRHRKPE